MEQEAMLAFLLFLQELPSLAREFSTSWLLLSSISTDCVCVCVYVCVCVCVRERERGRGEFA